VNCAAHGVHQIRVPWAEARSRFTALFEALAIRVLQETTLSGAATLLRMSWDEVEGILQRAVDRGLARRKAEPVQVIGIDETSFQKRHEYITIAVDLQADRVLWVGDGRRQATLEEFWRGLEPVQQEAVEAVVMDMWDPYVAATRKALPNGLSKIVIDRYHVMWHLNQAVDIVRKAEHRTRSALGDDRLRGTKYEWLRGLNRRTAASTQRLETLRRAGFKVGRAWAIKEAARALWEATDFAEAMAIFRRWYFWATHSRLKPVIAAARMIRRWLWGILRYHVHPYTNAMTEGVNSKIQQLKYAARGYRNRDNFRRAILFHCGGLSMDPR
jgi:transposase